MRTPIPAALAAVAVVAVLASGATGAPTSAISDEVHAPNSGTSCSGQATTSGIPRRSVVDLLDDPWRTSSQSAGAGIFLGGQLNAVVTPINPIPLTFPGSPITATVAKQDVTPAEAVSNATNSVGTQDVPNGASPGTFTSSTLQDCAPRPQSLYPGTGGGLPYFWNATGFGDANDSTTRDGSLFTFSQPVRSFGAWFGDTETRIDPDPDNGVFEGVPARLKLLDAAGNVLLNEEIPSDFRLEPDGPDADTDPDRIVIDQSLCGGPTQATDDHLGCGNQATRWIGFTSPNPDVAQMLVVVGDDDDQTVSSHQGLTEYLSWIGATLAESDGQLEIIKTADTTEAQPGDSVTYTLTVTNPGDRPEVDVQVVDALPPGLTAVSASDSGVVANTTVTWPLITLAARETRQLTVTGTLTGAVTGPQTNLAFATSPSEGLREAEAAVVFGAPPPVVEPPAPVAPPETPAAKTPAPVADPAPAPPVGTRLRIDKSAPPAVKGGGVGLYRITVKNTGNAVAQNVTVADAIPVGVSLVAGPGLELSRAKRALRRASVRHLRASSRLQARKRTRLLKAARIRVARARANRRAKLTAVNGLATWRLGDLEPGETRQVTLRVRFAGDQSRIVGNRAVVRAGNAARAQDAVRTAVRLARVSTLPAVTG